MSRIFATMIGLIVSVSLLASTQVLSMNTTNTLLIDDFSQRDGRATIGGQWQGFSDRVMGGLSSLRAGYAEADGQSHLFLRGQVRLDNNGGFIQVRLPLGDRRGMDLSEWDGIRLEVRAEPGPYYLHLRTQDTRQPWSYYRAVIAATSEWSTVDIPFTAFEARSLRQPLNLGQVQSLGIVAYGEAFDAHIEVREIMLYRQ